MKIVSELIIPITIKIIDKILSSLLIPHIKFQMLQQKGTKY